MGGTTLTITPYLAPPEIYAGVVTATSPDGRVALRTPISFHRPVPTFPVSVTVLGFDGKPNTGTAFVWFFNGGNYNVAEVKNGTARIDLPVGSYTIVTATPDQAGRCTAWVVETNRAIRGRTDLVLDARKAAPVRAVTREPTEVLVGPAST